MGGEDDKLAAEVRRRSRQTKTSIAGSLCDEAAGTRVDGDSGHYIPTISENVTH